MSAQGHAPDALDHILRGTVPQEIEAANAVGDAKRAATATARAALAGFQLVRMADGTFAVARWGMVSALADLAAVDAFLLKVGAPK